MDTSPLTPRQRGVLYVLVEQMARSHEITLTEAIAEDRDTAEEILDQMLYWARDIKSIVHRYGFKFPRLRPFGRAAFKLLEGDTLRIPFYLARKFDVPCSTLYFPGITDVPDRNEDDASAGEFSAGNLRIEFPDRASRHALLASLMDWSHLGLQPSPPADGVIAKVAALLEVPMPAARETAPA